MHKETELKLRASRETLAALREHPLLKKRNKSGWQTRELLNQYFDTPERELSAARVALRLRRDGDAVIQTLKCRGTSVAGLSERNEYEWNLDKVKLDLKKLDATCWPEQLAGLDKKTIKPLFTTDFSREYAEIAWGRGKSKVVIEAALDQGFVIAGKRKEEICELELELREGDPQALLELAAELAASLPLMPCDISKAERGYRLLEPDSYELGLPHTELEAEMALDDAYAALAWQLLGSAWTVERKGRGERQGKAQLASWLAHLLGEEGRALKLPLYTQRPEDLAEQLPRIEQLLGWLHHARQVLEAPQMDRLYGDLKKLHELAELPISDEVLEARIEQARAVDQSRGWKHLLKA